MFENETEAFLPPVAVHPPAPDPGPPRRRRRYLVPLLAVALLLAGSGVVLVPNLCSARLNRNESAAIATLKNISSAQSQCQASGVIDVDRNGSGEYGYFAELAGHVATRSGSRIAPPVLSPTFAALAGSRVVRSGYVFQMFLPGPTGLGVAEDPAGGDVGNDNGVDVGAAETLWCCYAWPRHQGGTGKRAFFINQSGDVLATNGAVRPYDGEQQPCQFHAAFCAGQAASMASMVAANTVAQDGNTWVVV